MNTQFHRLIDEDTPQLKLEYTRAAKLQQLRYVQNGKIVVTNFNPTPKLSRTAKRAIRAAVNWEANEQADKWAREYGGQLIRGIDESSRHAVNTLLRLLRDSDLSRDEAKRLIGHIVGLTDRQAATMASLAKDSAAARVYATQALDRRAGLIAHHETITAANMGLQLAYGRGLDLGILNSRSRKVWRTYGDNACPLCRPMNRKQAEITGEFSNGSVAPPLHVGCRCTMTLNIGS